jgi:hypothetical protein
MHEHQATLGRRPRIPSLSLHNLKQHPPGRLSPAGAALISPPNTRVNTQLAFGVDTD